MMHERSNPAKARLDQILTDMEAEVREDVRRVCELLDECEQRIGDAGEMSTWDSLPPHARWLAICIVLAVMMLIVLVAQ